MAYMRREERKDQIMLVMLADLDAGIKRGWTVTEIARAIGMARSTRVYQLMNELTSEGSLYRLCEPYRSGGITNYRWLYQVNESAYKQPELAGLFDGLTASIEMDMR